ncbi:hypothetical protein [Streptomyces sp. NPDC101776]|uniref:hypothetical protein n=1 Tax=Streptomyces sp. NPDC101776 TaxID=3366146 RepID=UPI0038218401
MPTSPWRTEPAPQTAAGKVLWHFTMSPDGFVAGPDHAKDWMTGFSFRPDFVEEHIATTGAVLGGDEIDLHFSPVLLGDGIRLVDNPGGRPGPAQAAER